ncbi:pentapeptide repeat-containing protein [Arthrospira platensis NCB002]|uniref:Pentapeptide repeat-containing protein n=1 Tax=Limnospira platensis NIES-46 TaxID=1236695 RepID=A0A5M3T9A8_LIMPL|nr:pentapeptide repeat-containing protein [Arthrospira platensis]MDF2207544.1 pentapeptide repeat-containing protein [Arthrospira platensis NCB002]BAI93202.1 pentapeptide repeat-containing protein [Arthrospira platensis NIES-39]BDT15445.1 pentapeptide repeat-containing protein [Arthrospira platensis NIES-39]GCE96054.1 pentapeptide repeat-containing protein [Arthrospira platensis NIES-46]
MVESSELNHTPLEDDTNITGGFNQRTWEVNGNVIQGSSVTVYLSPSAYTIPTEKETKPTPLGDNPYRGLDVFREEHSMYFFGREKQIDRLWEKFRDLNEDESACRFLPIYGTSGSGKSSLTRSGLIPELDKKPLFAYQKAKIAVLFPTTHPLESLATVLARIVTNDPSPVEKTAEFERVLKNRSDRGEYEGLRRIANQIPNIHDSLLVVVVDQFEEIFTLCKDPEEREAFINNLLCAAKDADRHTSVIVTMRSDFLRETQQYPGLDGLFSTNGFLVPSMQPEELEMAIAKPAELAGHSLEPAIIKLLIEQTQGREGALPLLQFALQRIWEGLEDGREPAETLEKIGGVGGALAGEVQRLYESLTPEDQILARRIFIALVNLDESEKTTRRRAPVSELITNKQEEPAIKSIIRRFSARGVRFLSTSQDLQRGETLEVTHEALIHNWDKLQGWLSERREQLHQKQKFERYAEEWRSQNKSPDYLLQSRILRDAQEFSKTAVQEVALSELATEFIKASQRQKYLRISLLFVFPSIAVLFIIHLSLIYLTERLLAEENCQPTPILKHLLWYRLKTGENNLERISLCGKYLNGINFEGAELSGANFQEARLNGANLREAVLLDANLQGARLYKADLYNAFLISANLIGANLESANLESAIMHNAKLQGADLRNADLQNADLQNVDLREVDLTQTTGLSQHQIESAILCNTKLPDYLLSVESKHLENRDCHRFN